MGTLFVWLSFTRLVDNITFYDIAIVSFLLYDLVIFIYGVYWLRFVLVSIGFDFVTAPVQFVWLQIHL